MSNDFNYVSRFDNNWHFREQFRLTKRTRLLAKFVAMMRRHSEDRLTITEPTFSQVLHLKRVSQLHNERMALTPNIIMYFDDMTFLDFISSLILFKFGISYSSRICWTITFYRVAISNRRSRLLSEMLCLVYSATQLRQSISKRKVKLLKRKSTVRKPKQSSYNAKSRFKHQWRNKKKCFLSFYSENHRTSFCVVIHI